MTIDSAQNACSQAFLAFRVLRWLSAVVGIIAVVLLIVGVFELKKAPTTPPPGDWESISSATLVAEARARLAFGCLSLGVWGIVFAIANLIACTFAMAVAAGAWSQTHTAAVLLRGHTPASDAPPERMDLDPEHPLPEPPRRTQTRRLAPTFDPDKAGVALLGKRPGESDEAWAQRMAEAEARAWKAKVGR